MSKSRRFQDAEALLLKAKRKEVEQEWNEAFQTYVRAAQAFFQIVQGGTGSGGSSGGGNGTIANSVVGAGAGADESGERAKAKANGSLAIERAQKLKSAYPEMITKPSRDYFASTEQSAVLAASSHVNGVHYPQWRDDIVCENAEDRRLFRDPNAPPLDPSTDEWVEIAQTSLRNSPMVDFQMLPFDLVQSIVSNCSVVTSIIVCWNHILLHRSKLLLSNLLPHDHERLPTKSSDHRYRYKMMINGCFRDITIDDRLPLRSGQLMSVAALRGSSLWPILVEKAYMKYSGGYDFAGSDSGVDLRALIGWIPDHQSLQSATFERERTWREMLDAFRKGDVLVTLGTGSTVSSLNPEIRLIPLHSYACIGLEDDEDRTVTIVNPWREQEQEPAIENRIHSLTLNNLEADPSRGKWLLSWDDVCRTFDSLYLNWNPNIFPYTLTHHRAWNPQEKHDHSPTQNHQIRVIFEKDPGTTQVWALLSRHIVDHDAPAVYIALHAFEEDGNGVSFSRPESLTLMGQYQEGPHCLVKLTPGTETKRLSLIASLSVPDGVTAPAQVAYTLTVYSKVPISFDASVPPALIKQHVTFQFNTLHSGGNILQPTHFQNPQWQLKVLEPTLKKGPTGPVALRSRGVRVRFHAIAPKDLPLNIKVYRTSGRRMNDVEDGVLAFDSGMYNYGLAYGQTDLFPGSYIIILSNFVATQYGGGTLEMSSEARLELQKSPAEGAGMHFKSCRGRWDGPSAAGGPSFHRYWHNPVFELKLERNTEVALKLQMLDIKQGTPYIPINLAIFKRDTVDGEQIEKEVATSGPYRESLYGVRVRPCRIPAGLYFVVASTYSPGTQGSFEILLWSDSLLALKSLE